MMAETTEDRIAPASSPPMAWSARSWRRWARSRRACPTCCEPCVPMSALRPPCGPCSQSTCCSGWATFILYRRLPAPHATVRRTPAAARRSRGASSYALRALQPRLLRRRVFCAIAAGALAVRPLRPVACRRRQLLLLDRAARGLLLSGGGAHRPQIGLVNTMVFTHLPSNLCLILLPFAPNLWLALALLLIRSALSQMDVPTRTSYVMAVVTPAERAAAASVTAVPRSLAAAVSPLAAGYLLGALGLRLAAGRSAAPSKPSTTCCCSGCSAATARRRSSRRSDATSLAVRVGAAYP